MSKTNSYNEATILISKVLDSPLSAEEEESLQAKEVIQEGYSYIATNIYAKTFLNWGIWDKKLYKEYCGLHYNFSALCPYQDPHSPLMLYYLLSPLIKEYFFNKAILDIGPGNGIGLKMSSQLLKANYALGVDLTYPLVANAKANFSKTGKIEFIQGDAEQLPVANNSFDLVINIESSHLYPNIELFFAEVFRVLKPGGFFCYSDIEFLNKLQAKRLDAYIETRNDIRIIKKQNLTKLVQNAIYMRLISNEQRFIQTCVSMFGSEPDVLTKEATSLAHSMGIAFLPWWKIWVKSPLMRPIAKTARQANYFPYKYYFSYLLQKI